MKSSLMNSSFKKLRGLAHQKSKPKDKREQQQQRRPHAKQDELLLASQDMQDMRDCYDSLLSAAAATANSAYEFSEALQEMGSCLLEKTSLNDDEDGGQVLLMLGKVQFLLQKLVDNYRAHIIQTITTPSESHLKELQTLEDMKRQCDYKRDSYNAMVAAHKEKGRLKNTKGETITLQQLQSAQEEYEEEATQFIFRLKSLKKGQSRSLLTQAARHHAAQLNFFRKGLTALDVVEPHVKTVAERQHIDYQFSGLEDNGSEDGDDHSYDGSDDGELSFDYGQNEQGQDVVSTSRNLMELDSVDHHTGAPTSTMESAQETVDRSQAEFLSFSRGPGAGSQSAPILSNVKFDSSEKTKEMQPSSERKFRTYVLPTPVTVKSPNLVGSAYPAMLECKSGWPTQLWHSSPLEPDKFLKDPVDEPSNPNRLLEGQLVLKESNINCGLKMPPPLAEELSLRQLSSNVASDAKKIKRQAFSGPLTDKTHSSKPTFSAIESRHSVDCPPVLSSKPTRVSTPQRSVSPPPISSPKISELHELPRPPIILGTSQRPSSLIGHSAPLVSRGHEHSATSKIPSGVPQKASPLPIPPKSMPRCFSIPSSGQRTPPPSTAKFLETPHNLDLMEEVASPTLTPMSLPTKYPA